MRYRVVSIATVRRTYFVEADDRKEAIAAATDKSPDDEIDVCEETLEVWNEPADRT